MLSVGSEALANRERTVDDESLNASSESGLLAHPLAKGGEGNGLSLSLALSDEFSQRLGG